jgi:hypothetical protein
MFTARAQYCISRRVDVGEFHALPPFGHHPDHRIPPCRVVVRGLLVRRKREFPTVLEECFQTPIEGAIYAEIIDRLRAEGAIRPAVVDTSSLVHTAWDLGSPLNTVTWYFQIVAAEIRVIDCDSDLDLTPVQRVARMLNKGY